MKTNKQVMVVSFTGDSGLTDYSVSLCKELQKIAEVIFVTAESYQQEKYRTYIPVIKIFRRTRHYPVDIFKFLFFVLSNKPDVILFQSWIKYPSIEWLITKLFQYYGITTALTIHDLLPHYPKPWSKFVLSKYYRCFDKLIVHSGKSQKSLLNMNVNTPSLFVPHGVYDIFNFDQLLRHDVAAEFPSINDTDFTVLFFGHIETRKGILEFLASSQLLHSVESVKFIVAGGSTLDVHAKKEFDAYRNNQNILLHDHRIAMEDVQKYFTLSDVVVLPYLEGTTSGVLKLAMAFDKPIIATDVGDFSETLLDWPGILIKTDDVAQEISNAVISLKENYASHMQKLNKNKKKYQWDSIASKYLTYLINSKK